MRKFTHEFVIYRASDPKTCSGAIEKLGATKLTVNLISVQGGIVNVRRNGAPTPYVDVQFHDVYCTEIDGKKYVVNTAGRGAGDLTEDGDLTFEPRVIVDHDADVSQIDLMAPEEQRIGSIMDAVWDKIRFGSVEDVFVAGWKAAKEDTQKYEGRHA